MLVEIKESDIVRLNTILSIYHSGLFTGMIASKDEESKRTIKAYAESIKRIYKNINNPVTIEQK